MNIAGVNRNKMDLRFHSLNEDDDPYPKSGAYGSGLNSKNAGYGFEEELAKRASKFAHRHFDQGHMIEPDETCDLCRELGLVQKVLH